MQQCKTDDFLPCFCPVDFDVSALSGSLALAEGQVAQCEQQVSQQVKLY
jgi:hypothetical protein